ncbi:MAG: class I SAM-dependent methyltransferase [Dehalococcoidia bacterium]
MTTQALDPAQVEAFAGQMVGVLNSAAVALMTSIGHQTGLFDIMAGMPASTSGQIADAAGLQERYVREWLGAMVTGRIVELAASTGTFWLPPERAACLTRAAGPDNLAAEMQFIPLLGAVEQGIVHAFRQGGGVPYAQFPRFQALMAEGSAMTNDAALIEVILPLVPGLPERLQAGIAVADIGCGCGHAINLMARAFPRSRFTGYDFSEHGIATAQTEAGEWALHNASFVTQDVARLDVRAAYDLITAFDAIHDQAQPGRVLQNIATALKPGGTYLMADIAASSNLADNLDHPLAPLFYTLSTMHCLTVSLALDGEGLGAMWGEQKARHMLAASGFSVQDVKQVPADIINTYYLCAKA